MKTQAAFIKKTGAPSVIEWGEIELPPLKDQDVLVKVEAAAVDHLDTYIRSGKYKPDSPISFPWIIGRDLVGTVEKVGPKAKKYKVGQKVWTNSAGTRGGQGATAVHAIVEEDYLYPVPAGVDPIQLVATVHAGATVCRGLIQAAQLRTGEIIFVNGGGGSVGSTLIQLARARGARVCTSTSGKEKIAWCKEIGADIVFDYKKDNIEQLVRTSAPQGVHVFWDTSRNPNFDLAVKLLGHQGRMVLMSGAEERPPFPIGPFYNQEMSLRGFTLRLATKEDLQGYADILNRCLAEKKLKSKIARTFPLAATAEAHALLESEPDLWGKIVLTT